MSNPSSSKDLSSIKQIGESSLAGSGVRGLGVDNLEEAHVGFYCEKICPGSQLIGLA